MDDKKVGTLLVAIPVLHVFSTSIFLWAYALGFGGNLSAFLAPSDIFSTSMMDMIRVYITSIIIPAALSARRHLPGYKPPTPISSERSRKLMTWSFYATLSFVFLVAMAFEILLWYTGRPFSFFILNLALLVILAPILLSLSDKLQLSLLQRDIFYIGSLFVLSALLLGLDAGSRDRHYPYAALKSSTVGCKVARVIRRIDKFYLVGLPNRRKALITEDCSIKFMFPKVIETFS